MTNHNVFKDDFTPAEEKVLRLIVKGFSNKEICKALCIANTTVKTHLNNIYQKSGINKFTGFSDFAVLRVRLVLKYLDKYKD